MANSNFKALWRLCDNKESPSKLSIMLSPFLLFSAAEQASSEDPPNSNILCQDIVNDCLMSSQTIMITD